MSKEGEESDPSTNYKNPLPGKLRRCDNKIVLLQMTLTTLYE